MDTVPSGYNTWAELLTVVSIVPGWHSPGTCHRPRHWAESGMHPTTTTSMGHQWASDVTPAS
jgi:hypothetical protein